MREKRKNEGVSAKCLTFLFMCIVMIQVQYKLPEKVVVETDRWVAEGCFKSRSKAIKTVIGFYQERKKTREFFRMLFKRSGEARQHPERLVSLEDLYGL